MSKDILNSINESDELNLRDDDHLDKPDLTEKEAKKGFEELADKYKDRKPVSEKEAEKFSGGVIDALNKIGIILLTLGIVLC